MKRTALALALVGLLLPAMPALAQLGGLNKAIGKAQKAKEETDKVKGIVISDSDERKIGEDISAALIHRFGVYQDKDVTKYVSLVGSVLAQASSRPSLKWEFIVLDTDGVNAYAAPGGLVHITRGALGLIKNEAELAGVLGHEITHVTAKHTINTIRDQNLKNLAVGAASDKAGGLTREAVNLLSGAGFDFLYNGKFSQGDEKDSDRIGTALANKVGYAPTGMSAVLQKIADRNKNQKEPNGWFASHPAIQERIAAMKKQIKDEKLNATALVAGRYTTAITFDVKAAAMIATITPGAKGLAGDSAPPKDDKTAKPEDKKAEPAKKSGLGSFLTKGTQAQNTGTVASAGSRGLGADRDAVGGSNKSKVRITLTPAEIETFKKGIA
jgi:predicted Zn-dependent protease